MIAQPTITPEQIAEIDCAYWAHLRKIRLQGGPFSFDGHEYQKEPLGSESKRVVYLKATGGGFSELEILKSLHGMIYKRYPQGVLYLFPTAQDVLDYSKARFAPLVLANRDSIGKYVKVGGRGTDTAGLKKIHDAFLYLRGATLSNSMGADSDEKESSQLRGIQVDRVVFDEVGLMDDAAIAKAKGRMGHTEIKEEVYISNPGRPGDALDLLFQDSDQRYYYNLCSCGHETCAAKSFPNCVKIRDDGTGYVACDKCGKEIVNRTVGTWRADFPARTEAMRGYHWCHLNSTFHDPVSIIRDLENPPQGNVSDVWRLRMGFSHQEKEDQLTTGAVLECCGNDAMPTQFFDGPCAMGVDIGKTFHVLIGIRTGKERYELIRIARVSNWTDLHDLAQRYNVRSAMVDLRPYEDSARAYRKAETHRVWLSEYVDGAQADLVFNEATGVVKVDRTSICDQSHKVIEDKRIKLPRRCPSVDEFADQVCSAAKVLQTNKRTGAAVYRYIKLGRAGDHFRHALNYFLIAAGYVGVTSNSSTWRKPASRAICEYSRI